MVIYSPRAAKALGYLKRSGNDVEIYVEDTTSLGMWVRVLRSLLPPATRLKSVTMLGGRNSVVAACRLDQADDGRRKLYIIDGDLDNLCGKRRQRLRFLHRLRAYCIENLLINKHALANIASESRPNWPMAKVDTELAFPDIRRSIETVLKPLFVLYATASRLCPAVKTVGYSVYRLFKTQSGKRVLDNSAVARRWKSVATDVIQATSLAQFMSAWRTLRQKAKRKSGLLVVSAKDYIMPMLHVWLRDVFGYRGDINQFKARLALEFDPRLDRWLAAAVGGL